MLHALDGRRGDPERSGSTRPDTSGNTRLSHLVLLRGVWCLRHRGISSLGVLGTARHVFTKAQPTCDGRRMLREIARHHGTVILLIAWRLGIDGTHTIGVFDR
jgi:hypothetical protein